MTPSEAADSPVPQVDKPLTPQAMRRVLVALIGGQICLHAAMAGTRMAAPLMILREGAGTALPAEAAAGLLLGLFAAAPVLTAMPSGRWADRRGYHKPARAAVAMVVVGSVCAMAGALLGGWGRALMLVLGAVLTGTGANLGLIAIQREAGRVAALVEASDAGHEAAQTAPPFAPAAGGEDAATRPALLPGAGASARQVFSWLGMAPSLSNVIGPVLAGFLIDAGGFALAFGVLALLPLATGLWARRVPRETPKVGAAARARSSLQGIRELLALPGIKRLLVLNWFFSTSWDLHSFLVPLLGHERGLSASLIGSVLGVFALAVTGVRFVIPFVASRLRERAVLIGALVVVAAVYAVYPFAHNAATMMACAVVLGLALGCAAPMILSTLHHLAPAQRQGEAMALRSAWINLSSATLPVCFGLLGGAYGAGALFRGMAVLLVLALWLQVRQEGRQEGRPPA